MHWISILKKVAMALTGLGLFGFLVTHLAGNFKLFAGPGAFNGYAGMLADLGLLLLAAEAGLLGLFLIHGASGSLVTLENSAARPQPYAVKNTAGASTFASRTMIWSGLVILVFVAVHIMNFKFADKELAGPLPEKVAGVDVPAVVAGAAKTQPSLWHTVIKKFKQPHFAGAYVFAMLILGLHLSHAFASALQTLGLEKPGWRPRLRLLGCWLGWAIAVGFAVFPVWGYFFADLSRPL